MATIIVFGTSITAGMYDLEKGGWVERLKNFTDNKYKDENGYPSHVVYNLGISGDTSADILRRFEFEITQRIMRSDEKHIFVIGLGTNDAMTYNDTGRFYVELNDFQKNIKKLIKISKKLKGRLIIIGPFWVDQGKVDPIPWVPENCSYLNANLEIYNKRAAEICENNLIMYIDMMKVLDKEKYISALGDGVHPDPRGHQMIFDIVKKPITSFL